MDKNIKNFPEDLNMKLKIEAAKKKSTDKAIIIEILSKYFKGDNTKK